MTALTATHINPHIALQDGRDGRTAQTIPLYTRDLHESSEGITR